MSIRLLDAFCGFGGTNLGDNSVVGVDELLQAMDRLDIGRALLRTVPLEIDAILANNILHESCKPHARLFTCPVVIPNTGCDLMPESEQIGSAIDHQAGAVVINPQNDYWNLSPWVCDRLFEAIDERRMPVLCPASEVSPEEVGDLAQRYRRIPFILIEQGYRSQRTLLPLLEHFSNIYMSIGGAYSLHKGIDQIVTRVGTERLVFGTGFPLHEPAAAVTYLMYSGLSDEQKSMVGHENIERLIGGIER